MRFFRNAARSSSKANFLSILSQTISLAFSVFRGRARKDVFVFKLIKLLIIALIEKKYTVEAALCCSTFIVYCQKATPLQQNQTYLLLVSAGLKEKKHADEYLFCFLNFIFHQLLIT